MRIRLTVLTMVGGQYAHHASYHGGRVVRASLYTVLMMVAGSTRLVVHTVSMVAGSTRLVVPLSNMVGG